MSMNSTQRQLDEYKKKVLAEKKKDPKAFNDKYGKKPPSVQKKCR